jgi:hypothetical protein
VLIYSMSVSVDGSIADRDGASGGPPRAGASSAARAMRDDDLVGGDADSPTHLAAAATRCAVCGYRDIFLPRT